MDKDIYNCNKQLKGIMILMNILENKSDFADNELVQIAKRDNNPKRSYLLVNPSQGKHVPVSPEKPLTLFKELADELKKNIIGERTLFIGFAETATAVGAGVAAEFADSRYICTTREIIPDTEMIVDFKEEHSHAVQQTLQCDNWKKLSEGVEQIVFVEDEVSTGTTIMNFISALKSNKRIGADVKFAVCSIINGMSDERLKELSNQGVNFCWLMRIAITGHEDNFIFKDTPANSELISHGYILKRHRIVQKINPRTGCKTSDFIAETESFAAKIGVIADAESKYIAVVGTEEFMYPAIKTAEILKRDFNAAEVFTHSTTRSPVEPHFSNNYPLNSRFSLTSFYESGRQTYIYNTDYYDKVIIVTDGDNDEAAVKDIIGAFDQCTEFIIVRWQY